MKERTLLIILDVDTFESQKAYTINKQNTQGTEKTMSNI